MTLTSHGHHVVGTIDTDEDPDAVRARCGGPKLCRECAQESVRIMVEKFKSASAEGDKLLAVEKEADNTMYEKQGVYSRLRVNGGASGPGILTVEMLKIILKDVPDNAELQINTTMSDWVLSASWDAEESFSDPYSPSRLDQDQKY